ncbi:hypothetical protein RJ639_011782 [Escallonia herrerae]|uniref:Cytochrome P450 n=1 Tax=Escallonia herrerae TaxID=1293975 RepID=A0AA88VQX9_9ASTE|nr:hypothetical protein RJ639_011782 [Escallonia herrerae]
MGNSSRRRVLGKLDMHFMPERFLKSEVDFNGQHFSFLPFGSGRRICPDIPLAQRAVSLMIASLVYHFDRKLPHSTNELDMNAIFCIQLLRATPPLAVPMNFREGITGYLVKHLVKGTTSSFVFPMNLLRFCDADPFNIYVMSARVTFLNRYLNKNAV